ncbi:unnamed protein product [Amoebophrya sp. A120]|nr:unnamed protein product [Amoebophrya sp. A120]|eukprot:GSA120T00001901001.1
MPVLGYVPPIGFFDGTRDQHDSNSSTSQLYNVSQQLLKFAGIGTNVATPPSRVTNLGSSHDSVHFSTAARARPRGGPRGRPAHTSFLLDCTGEEPYGLDYRVVDEDARESHTALCARYRNAFKHKHMVNNLKIMATNCPQKVHYWVQSSNMMVSCCLAPGAENGEGDAKCQIDIPVAKPEGLFEKMKHSLCRFRDPNAILTKTATQPTWSLVKLMGKILAVLAMFEVIGPVATEIMDAGEGPKKGGKFVEPCDENSYEPCSIKNLQKYFRATGMAVMAFSVIRKIMAYSCIHPGGVEIDANHVGEVQGRTPRYGLTDERVVMLQAPHPELAALLPAITGSTGTQTSDAGSNSAEGLWLCTARPRDQRMNHSYKLRSASFL